MQKISIITICYNCKDDLRTTIHSVISQDYTDYEYIIVDGGSTDGTLDVIKENQHHITTFISESDEGIYDALNKGVLLSSGTWILCLNAGDKLSRSTILSEVFSINGLDKYKVIYSDCLVERKDGTTYQATMNRSKGVIHHQNAIYRKSLHTQKGMYLVTKPYIVSDLLFLLSIEERYYYKYDSPIAISKEGGISCALWSGEQAIGLRIALGIDHLPSGFIQYLILRCRLWIHHIKTRM